MSAARDSERPCTMLGRSFLCANLSSAIMTESEEHP